LWLPCVIISWVNTAPYHYNYYFHLILKILSLFSNSLYIDLTCYFTLWNTTKPIWSFEKRFYWCKSNNNILFLELLPHNHVPHGNHFLFPLFWWHGFPIACIKSMTKKSKAFLSILDYLNQFLPTLSSEQQFRDLDCSSDSPKNQFILSEVIEDSFNKYVCFE